MTMVAPKVGDKLWYVPLPRHGYGEPQEVTVIKVGRKWFEVDDTRHWFKSRFSNLTWEEDGGQFSSPGKCWVDKATYDEADRLDREWRELRGTIAHRWQPPAGLTADAIVQARKILNLTGAVL